MRVIALLLSLAVVIAASAKVPVADQLKATADLVRRLLPERVAAQFSFAPLRVDTTDGFDCFEVDGLQIRANSGVAAAYGWHYYLRHVAEGSVHWGRNGTGLHLDPLLVDRDTPLPQSASPFRRCTKHKYRYYMNAVTFGYSSAWWDWERWQVEIDWAALHGVNLFLALEGQEFVWEQVWLELGLTPAELESYFPGPSFLAWHRMGNLDAYMSPQPAGWRKDRAALQKLILGRMRALGMTAVQTAFAGHVPRALMRLYPQLQVHQVNDHGEGWCGFAPTTLLLPSDPLFRTISKRFLDLQSQLYGTDHVYSCDTWNEMHPPSADPAFLAASSRAVIDGMRESDPDAVWLMQGWLFQFSQFWQPTQVHGYLSGVPDDRMIVLDLFAEKRSIWDETESFFGKPWIWCQLLNFGGTHGLYGNMTRVATEPARALRVSPSFAGTGMSMESIERNPIMFSLLTDTAWQTDPIDLEHWLYDYAAARYGSRAAGAGGGAALVALNASVYHYNGQLVKSPIDERPKIYDVQRGWNPPAYEPTAVSAALKLLLQSGSTTAPFRQDLVDVARQVLVDAWTDVLLYFQRFVALGNVNGMITLRRRLLNLLDELDGLLGSNVNFLLGPVLAESRRYNESDAQQLNILTLWGDGRILNDYAAKEWSPLVGRYYRRRWDQWLTGLIEGKSVNAIVDHIKTTEQAWWRSRVSASQTGTGDEVQRAIRVLRQFPPSADWRNDAYRAQTQLGVVKQSALIYKCWSTNPTLLAELCSEDPTCGGFFSNGYLFAAGETLVDKPDSELTVYVKLAPARGEQGAVVASEVSAAQLPVRGSGHLFVVGFLAGVGALAFAWIAARSYVSGGAEKTE